MGLQDDEGNFFISTVIDQKDKKTGRYKVRKGLGSGNPLTLGGFLPDERPVGERMGLVSCPGPCVSSSLTNDLLTDWKMVFR